MIAILYGSDPWLRSDGGSVRVQALAHALGDFGPVVVTPGGALTRLEPGSRGKRVKQALLPLPLRRSGAIRSVADQLATQRPELIISASHALTPAAHGQSGAHLWVDFFDRWSDFGQREAAHRRGITRITAASQARLWQRRERTEARHAAAITAASVEDAQSLGRARWIPTPVPVHVDRLSRPQGRRAGFLANFAYWPNIDAFDALKTTWLPTMAAQGWEIVVAGYEAKHLAPTPGIVNLGEVDTVEQFYEQVDVCLAPIRLGGGMKVKVIEALAHGRPVLATPEGVKGLPPLLQSYVGVNSGSAMDVDSLLAQLDFSDRLRDALLPFRIDSFNTSVRDVADGLLGGAQ